MTGLCIQCGSPAASALLCEPCAVALACAERVLPEHIVSSVTDRRAEAWFVDRWGRPHGLAADRTTIGRSSDSDLALFDESVSREHAVISRRGGEWVVRDLGSKNSTRVGDSRVEGRAPLTDGVDVCFGEVAFYFRVTDEQLIGSVAPVVSTAEAGPRAFRLEANGVAILVLSSFDGSGDADAVVGRASYRVGDGEWAELPLPPMELRLLIALCHAQLAANTAVGDRGAIPSRQLARLLPFKTRYANDDNVRQLVKRLRASLAAVGIEGLIDAARHRGYFVAWPVSNRAE